ncbi:MAG: hypothetical protein AVDCRST_MAG87-686 [uncultured Thermomicrobiales bacterium]|uniref:Uncharacterized protein n=1 Tax=uncultured Thermomicrobiales bacterium TaxID=1645740 RepID=A0A6J4UH91_9BACT|nr:MAG: hypothetical protein AVDCRST_MAG87-686 [uncultured Thermomicrobiales bacterium]
MAQLVAKDAHMTGGDWNQPQHSLEQGALARSVGTDNGGDLSGFDIEIDIPDDRILVVGDGQVANLDDWC